MPFISRALMTGFLTLSSAATWAQSTSSNADLAPPELSIPVLDTNTPNTGANQASITQASDLNLAYIVQRGTGNLTVIQQSGHNSHLAVITQTGNNNRAFISQQ